MQREEKKEVRVFAPATVANVACGYDVLGFAIDAPGDEVIARHSDEPGLRITKITGDDGKLPLEAEKNTAGVAALDLLKHLGMLDRGIELEIHKKMPFGSGLGSSAASAVAGAYAVNCLIGEPLTKKQLLPFAMTGEASADGAWHADNVGPCLLGGIVFIRDNQELDIANLPVPKDLWAAVVHPDIEILTKVARGILPTEVPLENVTQQIGNLGGLICGLIQEDYGLISRSVHDVIAEPRRQKLIPEFYQAKRAALGAGALGFSISGAGPSVFALCEGEESAKKVGAAVSAVFSKVDLTNQLYVSRVNKQGVTVIG
ncbi:homoserine kinase [Akkermansiaceae bacterium]|nr:homoserine kinase [Akkermansiaceae bacterium]MDB4319472.1 homoserine kinase [bacterium]MDA7876857.1 homoserine kinase [Akkermansiaceae bacterium]MDA8875796.1 homoserine kinase [Akkermansiaceae bacterium]MDB0055804.1 homoserine kinase [Akkermansiaceae bacterium]